MEKISKKILLVTRHAHRDTSDKSLDNGLDDKGRRQAESLSTFLLKKNYSPDSILSSPKKRCLETLEPFASQKKIKIAIDPLLDEEESEGGRAFRKRIGEFADQWMKSENSCTLICSHGDWIPEFFSQVLRKSVDLAKGGIAIVELDPKEKTFDLLEVHQKT